MKCFDLQLHLYYPILINRQKYISSEIKFIGITEDGNPTGNHQGFPNLNFIKLTLKFMKKIKFFKLGFPLAATFSVDHHDWLHCL